MKAIDFVSSTKKKVDRSRTTESLGLRSTILLLEQESFTWVMSHTGSVSTVFTEEVTLRVAVVGDEVGNKQWLSTGTQLEYSSCHLRSKLCLGEKYTVD